MKPLFFVMLMFTLKAFAQTPVRYDVVGGTVWNYPVVEVGGDLLLKKDVQRLDMFVDLSAALTEVHAEALAKRFPKKEIRTYTVENVRALVIIPGLEESEVQISRSKTNDYFYATIIIGHVPDEKLASVEEYLRSGKPVLTCWAELRKPGVGTVVVDLPSRASNNVIDYRNF